MKRYLMAALVVVSAPLFAMESDEDPVQQEQDTASIGEYFGLPCFAFFQAVGTDLQEFLEECNTTPRQSLLELAERVRETSKPERDEDSESPVSLEEENAALRRQLQESQDAVFAYQLQYGKAKKS